MPHFGAVPLQMHQMQAHQPHMQPYQQPPEQHLSSYPPKSKHQLSAPDSHLNQLLFAVESYSPTPATESEHALMRSRPSSSKQASSHSSKRKFSQSFPRAVVCVTAGGAGGEGSGEAFARGPGSSPDPLLLSVPLSGTDAAAAAAKLRLRLASKKQRVAYARQILQEEGVDLNATDDEMGNEEDDRNSMPALAHADGSLAHSSGGAGSGGSSALMYLDHRSLDPSPTFLLPALLKRDSLACGSIRTPPGSKTFPFRSVIRCGVPDGLGRGGRTHLMRLPYFGMDRDMDVYTAEIDRSHTLLVRASTLADKFRCATNKIGMYLARRRTVFPGIYQATEFLCKPVGRTGLKVGGYFLTLDACADFERHNNEHRGKREMAAGHVPHARSHPSGSHLLQHSMHQGPGPRPRHPYQYEQEARQRRAQRQLKQQQQNHRYRGAFDGEEGEDSVSYPDEGEGVQPEEDDAAATEEQQHDEEDADAQQHREEEELDDLDELDDHNDVGPARGAPAGDESTESRPPSSSVSRELVSSKDAAAVLSSLAPSSSSSSLLSSARFAFLT